MIFFIIPVTKWYEPAPIILEGYQSIFTLILLTA